MGKLLVRLGFVLLLLALGWGGWLAWPIVFPSLPSGWLSTLAKADAALLQNRPDLAREALSTPPQSLPVSGWLQWEKRVQSVATQTQAWKWAASLAALAQSQYPGNSDLAAVLTWDLLKDHRPSEAATLAQKVLVGTTWESLARQAQVEALHLASGNWSELKQSLGDPSAASAETYEKLLALDPDPGLRKNALLSALASGNLEQARKHLDVLTPAQRDEPPFDRLQGLMAYDQGDWLRAASLLKSLNKSQPETLMVLADVYLHLGEPSQAQIIYDQLLADHPTDIPLALGINRATLFLDGGEPAEALALLTHVIELHPNEGPSATRLLALEARFRLGEMVTVRAALDKILEEPVESETFLDAELLRVKLFPETASLPRLWSLLHRHPSYAPLAERLTWLLLRSQDYSGSLRALDLHEAALERSGLHPIWWGLVLRAFIYAGQDRLKEADQALEAVPPSWRDAPYFANRALISAIRAQTAEPNARKPLLDDALERLTHALDLLPSSQDPAALHRRSLWLTRRGELRHVLIPLSQPSERGALRSSGTEDLHQAVLLDPDNLRASFLLRQAEVSTKEMSP